MSSDGPESAFDSVVAQKLVSRLRRIIPLGEHLIANLIKQTCGETFVQDKWIVVQWHTLPIVGVEQVPEHVMLHIRCPGLIHRVRCAVLRGQQIDRGNKQAVAICVFPQS